MPSIALPGTPTTSPTIRSFSAAEKIRRLDRMAAVLDGAPGDEAPAASAMRESLAATRITAQHCHDVLRAFRQDAEKRRYRDWDELMEYCRYSASPVGRQLLDLHRESRATWPSLRRAVLGVAGAQPPAGLRRRLSPARPGLPAHNRSCRCRNRCRSADGGAIEPGVARGFRCSARTDRRISSIPRADWRRASRREACAANARSSPNWRRAYCAACAAAIRWPPGSGSANRIFWRLFWSAFHEGSDVERRCIRRRPG